jgi:predicted transcriptional regulator
MSGIHDSSDHPPKTVPLTIHLSTESMSSLQNLAELYHATPERVAASWLTDAIDRRAAEMTASDDAT